MPTAGQRSGLSLAIADDAGDDEIGIIKRGAIGVAQRVAELAAFVNRARCLRRGMARNAAGEGELFKKPFHSPLVLRDIGIKLAVASLQIGIGHDRRSAVTGTGDEDHVKILLLDHAVQMHINEVQAGCGSPMSQ